MPAHILLRSFPGELSCAALPVERAPVPIISSFVHAFALAARARPKDAETAERAKRDRTASAEPGARDPGASRFAQGLSGAQRAPIRLARSRQPGKRRLVHARRARFATRFPFPPISHSRRSRDLFRLLIYSSFWRPLVYAPAPTDAARTLSPAVPLLQLLAAESKNEDSSSAANSEPPSKRGAPLSIRRAFRSPGRSGARTFA